MIEVKDVVKSFGDTTVLKGITTTFETGKTNRLPALTPASVEMAAELAARLAPTPIRLAGNYLHGLSLGDAAQYAAGHGK